MRPCWTFVLTVSLLVVPAGGAAAEELGFEGLEQPLATAPAGVPSLPSFAAVTAPTALERVADLLEQAGLDAPSGEALDGYLTLPPEQQGRCLADLRRLAADLARDQAAPSEVRTFAGDLALAVPQDFPRVVAWLEGYVAVRERAAPAPTPEAAGDVVAVLEQSLMDLERVVDSGSAELLRATAEVDRRFAALSARPDVAPKAATALAGRLAALRAAVARHLAPRSGRTDPAERARSRQAVLAAAREARGALAAAAPAPNKGRRSIVAGVVGRVRNVVDGVTALGQAALAGKAARLLETLFPPAGPGTPVVGPRPEGSPFVFPRDAGAHASVVEWWYYNGHFGSQGVEYGFELCFFKAVEGVMVCHVAVTDEVARKFHYTRFYSLPFDSRAAYGDLDLRFRMRNLGGRDLRCTAKRNKSRGASVHDHIIHGEVGPFSFTFELAAGARQPLAVNGNGIIDMPEGGDSWYYSLTRLDLAGTFSRPNPSSGRSEEVHVTGQAWMDHQWGMFYSLRRGWDWYSFQMDDGTDYNLFAMRRIDKGSFRYGSPSAETYANRMDKAGTVRTASNGAPGGPALEVRPLELLKGRTGTFATAWEVVVAPWDETFLVKARLADQEVGAVPPDPLPTYWEGSCDVWRRNPDGTFTRGLAYVEHMPYAKGFAPLAPRGDWPSQR